mgnify:CR=1 FL=1
MKKEQGTKDKIGRTPATVPEVQDKKWKEKKIRRRQAN